MSSSTRPVPMSPSQLRQLIANARAQGRAEGLAMVQAVVKRELEHVCKHVLRLEGRMQEVEDSKSPEPPPPKKRGRDRSASPAAPSSEGHPSPRTPVSAQRSLNFDRLMQPDS